MNVAHEETNNPENHVMCPLNKYYCKHSYQQNELERHLGSSEHFESIFMVMCLMKSKHDDAQVDLALCADLPDESASSTKNHSNAYLRVVENLTNLLSTNNSLLENENTDLRTTQILQNRFPSTDYSMMSSIQQMDRDQHYQRNIQEQTELINIRLNEVLRLMSPSPGTNEEIHCPVQDQQQPDNLSRIDDSSITRIQCLATQLAEAPASTDGMLIWHVDDISKKINDAVYQIKTFIDSAPFQTHMNGQRVSARLHLNGKVDKGSIAFNIHLNFPVQGIFRGIIRLILVDQSEKYPLKHIIKDCKFSASNVNDCFGFDHFVEKNTLHTDPNRYIVEDTACFIVMIKQNGEDKFANLTPSVRDAIVKNYLQ